MHPIASAEWQEDRHHKIIIVSLQIAESTYLPLEGNVIVQTDDHQILTLQFGAHLVGMKAVFVYVLVLFLVNFCVLLDT